MNKKQNTTIASALAWKLTERFGVTGVQFILQIVLARLLDPAYYGMLSMMTIFTALANVFVQTGFNTALVQNRDVTEEDYSSVFWVSMGIAVLLYALLFAAAPFIGAFYSMPEIVAPFRILALMLIPGAFNSIQLAKISREMNFRKVFFGNIGGILASGVVGIVCAYAGLGLWALVAQSLTNVTVSCLVMLFTVRWWPRLRINFRRVKALFSFGWKLLVSSLLNTLYADLSSLLVGKKYDATALGYYNHGHQYPKALITPINSAVQSVLLPAMSKKQDHMDQVKALTRQSITIGSFLIFPVMAGLAAVAEPLVRLVLTDVWLDCVPFLQVFCISYAFYHIHSANLQAINAMGRSDIFLKLEILKKSVGLCVLCIGVFCFDTPLAVAICTTSTAPLSLIFNATPNRKLIGYSIREQLSDISPSLLVAMVMFLAVWCVQLLPLSTLTVLLLQIFTGVVVYVLLSALFRLPGWMLCLRLLKKLKDRT